MRKVYIGGSKSNEKAILKYQRMKVSDRTKLLQRPSVKSKKSMKGKYDQMIKIIKREQ